MYPRMNRTMDSRSDHVHIRMDDGHYSFEHNFSNQSFDMPKNNKFSNQSFEFPKRNLSENLDQSRDSGIFFPHLNVIGSKPCLPSNFAPPMNTSCQNQSVESGFAFDSSLDTSFNRLCSMRNISFDGCFVEEDVNHTGIKPQLNFGSTPTRYDHKSMTTGILSNAISHGGDIHNVSFLLPNVGYHSSFDGSFVEEDVKLLTTKPPPHFGSAVGHTLKGPRPGILSSAISHGGDIHNASFKLPNVGYYPSFDGSFLEDDIKLSSIPPLNFDSTPIKRHPKGHRSGARSNAISHGGDIHNVSLPSFIFDGCFVEDDVKLSVNPSPNFGTIPVRHDLQGPLPGIFSTAITHGSNIHRASCKTAGNPNFDGSFIGDGVKHQSVKSQPNFGSTPFRHDVKGPSRRILPSDVSQGGDNSHISFKTSCVGYPMLKYALKLRRCWNSICLLNNVHCQMAGEEFILNYPVEWNLSCLLHLFQVKLDQILRDLKSPRLRPILLELLHSLEVLKTSVTGNPVNNKSSLDQLHKIISMSCVAMYCQHLLDTTFSHQPSDKFRSERLIPIWNSLIA